MMDSKSKLRVVIVGGSVAGLTLAHCLEKNDIDFVVLESHGDIAPQVGASIGILPNGARILDQLGVFDDILDAVEPMSSSSVWSNEAKLIVYTKAAEIIHERHGYPISFLDRQIVLEILYRHLREKQAQVHVNKKVVKVEHLDNKAVVHCSDGSCFEGDIVVGADGVRSTVRQEMWRHMESAGLEAEAEAERNAMTSEYNCVFGISSATPGMQPGDSNRTYAEGYSFLSITGKHGRVFWFLFTKMDRKFNASSIPRYSQQDLEEHVSKYMHKPITGTVPFSEVYKRAITTAFVALEEAFYQHWHMDRIVCIGDSIHKMTANQGQGGNGAIESAALLANHLSKLCQDLTTNEISLDAINKCLHDFQEARVPRIKKIWSGANALTRLEACATVKDKLIALHLMPYLADLTVDKSSAIIIGAEKLDALPLPPKSLNCTMPFVAGYDRIQVDPLWQRLLQCVPLMGCYAIAGATMGGVIQKVYPHLGSILRQGTWTASNGEVFDLFKPLYHIPFLDTLFQPLITCFLPSISGSDMISRAQMLSFMADIGPVYGIWLVESYRKAHSGLEVALPMALGTAFQLKGIGKFAPIYYMLEYLRVPISKLLLGDTHEIKPNALKSFLPAMLAGYYIPALLNFYPSTVEARRQSNAIWQLFPIVVPLLQVPFRLLQKRRTKDVRKEAKEQPRRDLQRKKNMRYIRCAYISFALISGASFIHARLSAPADASLASIFLPALGDHTAPVSSFAEGIARFLKYDQVISMASSFIWLGLRFRELKQNGAQFTWWKAVGGLVGTVATFGPGAALSLGWGWREELLNQLSCAAV